MDPQVYILYTALITFSWQDFVQVPNCGYTLTYAYYLEDKSDGSRTALPVDVVQSGNDFNVYSTDPSFEGNYYVVVEATTPASYMNPVLTEELLIDLEVTNDC